MTNGEAENSSLDYLYKCRILALSMSIQEKFARVRSGLSKSQYKIASVAVILECALYSGFSLVIDASWLPERMRIRIRATTSGELSRITTSVERQDLTQCSRVQEINELFCERSVLIASGQLFGLFSTAGIGNISATHESRPIGKAEFGSRRPDVSNKYPAIPQADQSDFSFRGWIGVEEIGIEHTVSK
jgi:hypothetical protein